MIYELVQTVNGRFEVRDFDANNVVAAMAARGFEQRGTNDNPRHRAELQGQPMFHGVLGPMWGGTRKHPDGVIRYECPETYKQLSQ